MQQHNDLLSALRSNISRVIHGQPDAINLTLTCLLAEGHLLVEDVPGVGKTSLARALATSIDGRYQRIQFTPDLLPSDVTGVSIYQQKTGEFLFHEGPVFANVVVADEINRASPKTQSALLEVMEERQVTIDGTTYRTPRPFMVVATQNPVDMNGTYALPEAQLDRFLMRLSMGYPDRESELTVLATHGTASRAAMDSIHDVVSSEDVASLIRLADSTYVAKPVMEYIVDLATATRERSDIQLGVSPRGSIALLRAARASALIDGRDFVTAGDIQNLAVPVLAHRIIVNPQSEFRGVTPTSVVNDALSSVSTPEGRAA